MFMKKHIRVLRSSTNVSVVFIECFIVIGQLISVFLDRWLCVFGTAAPTFCFGLF